MTNLAFGLHSLLHRVRTSHPYPSTHTASPTGTSLRITQYSSHTIMSTSKDVTPPSLSLFASPLQKKR